MAQLMSIKRNVEMCPGQVSVPAIYHVSQGDKGTRIILGLVNNSANYTIPEGTTATIRGHRADGTLFTEITADVETTEVKFNLTEDMSAVPGRAECEAVLASGSANIIGTANFIIDVEKSPASIGSVFPGTDAAKTWLIDELTNLDISDLDNESVVDAINNKASESTIAPEFSASASYTVGSYVYKNGVLYRFTSAHTGAWTGNDAEEVTVGEELNRLDNGSGSGLTEDVKVALLACFEKVAWIDEDGQDYYDALYNALYPPADLVSISAVFTQGSAVIYDTDSLDTLKQHLVVTAHMSDSSTQTVTSYALSGTLSAGTSTITVSYSGKTTTFNVTVTAEPVPLYPLENGSHTFTENNRSLIVTDGNHFEFTNPGAQSSVGTGGYLNLSTVSENSTSGTSISSITELTDVLFTIPANSNVVFNIKNINHTSVAYKPSNDKYTFALYTGNSVSEISTGEIFNTYSDISLSLTTSSEINVTCVYLYVKNSYSAFSADLELYVDGVMWI